MSSYFAFFDFMREVLKIDFDEFSDNYGIYRATTKLSLVYPFENWCVVCQKPIEINFNQQRLLHADGKPAIKYSDGFSVWNLNNVSVSQEIAETSPENLDAKILLKEQNAEIRREIVRKIGIEKVCKDLEAVVIDKGIDHKGQPCELITLNIGDNRQRPYLKMINPSIETYHIEGVHPNCKTITEAFNFRNGTIEKPLVLT